MEHFAAKAIFAPQLRIGLWCNGNTADFGSVILGSSPGRPTKAKISTSLFLLLKFLIEQNLKNICSHCCCIVTCTRVRRNEDAIRCKAGIIKILLTYSSIFLIEDLWKKLFKIFFSTILNNHRLDKDCIAY